MISGLPHVVVPLDLRGRNFHTEGFRQDISQFGRTIYSSSITLPPWHTHSITGKVRVTPTDLLQQWLNLRQSIDEAGEQGEHDGIEESWLTLGDSILVPVHERGDGIPFGLLEITLAEHLLLKQSYPLEVDILSTSKVSQVSALHGQL